MHGEWGEPRSHPSSKSSRSHRPGSSSGGSTRPPHSISHVEPRGCAARTSMTAATSCNGSSAFLLISMAPGSRSTRASATTSARVSRLERTALPVPVRSRGGGLPSRHHRRSCVHAPPRRPCGLEHRPRRRGLASDIPGTRAICSLDPEFEYWQATAYPDDDDVFGDSVAPVHDAGLVDLRGRRPCGRRREHPVRLDTGAHTRPRVSGRGVGRRAGGHHGRHDSHAHPDRRRRPFVSFRLRARRRCGDPRRRSWSDTRTMRS